MLRADGFRSARIARSMRGYNVITTGSSFMLNVVSILERLGQDASLRPRGGASMDRALHALKIDASLRDALANRDGAVLAQMIGASPSLVCGLFPGKEEEEESPDEESPDKDEEDPRKDEEKISSQRRKFAVSAAR